MSDVYRLIDRNNAVLFELETTSILTCLREAIKRGVHLTNVDLAGLRAGDLNFTGAYMIGANFTGAYLPRAKFIDANLSGADFSFATLYETKMCWANLTRVNLEKACLNFTDLRNANMCGIYALKALFVKADMQHVIARGANFRKANFEGANMDSGNFEFADFSKACLKDNSMIKVMTNGARFTGADTNYIILEEEDPIS